MGIMTKMRTQMHVVLWSLLILFLLSITVGGLVGGANILDQLFGRINPGQAIGAVNGEIITPDLFERSVAERMNYYRVPGQDLSDAQVYSIRQDTWDAMIQDLLINQAVDEYGITVSDEEVLFHLRNNPPPIITSQPVFQTNGVFDYEKYLQALDNPVGMDWFPIEEYLRNVYIPYFKLQAMVVASEFVSNDEVRDRFNRSNTQYTVDGIHVTRRAINAAQLQVSDEDLKKLYKQKSDELEQPERRGIRYVSWEKSPIKQDTTDIYNNALEVKNMALSGRSFADLANVYSEDPGNLVTPDSGRGGDLGWFTKDQMVKPFADAAFAAKPGDIVGPVLSNFGYHVIHVKNKRKGENGDEVNASHILFKISMGPVTRENLSKQATLFSYDAQDFGFDAALDSAGLTASTSSPFFELAQFIQGLGTLRSAVRFAFNNPVGTASEPFENDRYFAVAVVDTIIPEGKISFDEARANLETELLNERTMDETLIKATEVKSRIDNENLGFEALGVEDKGLIISMNKTFTLDKGLPSFGQGFYLTGALLNAKPGDLLGPVETLQGHAIFKVNAVSAFDSLEFETQKDLLYRNLLSDKKTAAFRNWLAERQQEAEIVDNRKYYY